MFKNFLKDMMMIVGGNGGFWLPLLGLAAGAIQANEQRKGVQRQNKAQAEITKHSPWTGMQGQMQAEPSVMGGALSGGMMGAMAGSQMGQFSDKPAIEPGKTPGITPDVSQSVSNISSAPVVQQPPSQGVSLMRPQGDGAVSTQGAGMLTSDYVNSLAQGKTNPWGRLY